MKPNYRSFLLLVGVCIVAIQFCSVAAEQVSSDGESFHYHIDHERWGRLGTFSNTIQRRGDLIEVGSRLRAKLKFIITLHSERADRKEIWSNGRLVSFHSETILNGDVIRIQGRAKDGSFMIYTTDGILEAPADVIPTNPWSTDVLNARFVMGTTRGSVVAVTLATRDNQIVHLDGQSLQARHLRLLPRGDPGMMPFPQEVWFDQHGIPIMFSVVKDGKRITFTMSNYEEALKKRQNEN
ncbi:MAG: DUF6134 family protein [Geminicoccaceae bacterium]